MLNKADDKTAELYINLFGEKTGNESGMIALKQRVKGVPFKYSILVFERLDNLEMVDVWYVAKYGQGLFLKAVRLKILCTLCNAVEHVQTRCSVVAGACDV